MSNVRYGIECPEFLDDEFENFIIELIKKCLEDEPALA